MTPRFTTDRDANRVAKVRAWAKKQTEAFESFEVKGRFGITSTNAHQVLSRLVAEGVIVRISMGVYKRATTPQCTCVKTHSPNCPADWSNTVSTESLSKVGLKR